MAPLPMLLNDLEGHFCCLKPFQIPYLVKRSTDFLTLRVARSFYSSKASCWQSCSRVQFLALQCMLAKTRRPNILSGSPNVGRMNVLLFSRPATLQSFKLRRHVLINQRNFQQCLEAFQRKTVLKGESRRLTWISWAICTMWRHVFDRLSTKMDITVTSFISDVIERRRRDDEREDGDDTRVIRMSSLITYAFVNELASLFASGRLSITNSRAKQAGPRLKSLTSQFVASYFGVTYLLFYLNSKIAIRVDSLSTDVDKRLVSTIQELIYATDARIRSKFW